MIRKTKRRLIGIISIVVMLWLLVFATVAYFTVSHSILDEQRNTLKRITIDEIENYQNNFMTPTTEMKVLFYYVVNINKDITLAKTQHLQLTEKAFEKIGDWRPSSFETKQLLIEANNQDIDMLVAATPIADQNQILGYVFTGINITPQMNAVRQLMTTLIILSIVFTAASMLIGYFLASFAIRPIIEALQRQRQFVNDASHELRTPISIVRAGLEVLQMEEKKNWSEFSTQTADDMMSELKRMTNLTNDLLTLARDDSGKTALHLIPFDFTELAHQTIRSFEVIAQEKGVKLITSIQPSLSLTADQTKIQQLLYVFLDNAIKYNLPDGDIHLSAQILNNQLQLVIEDSGIGIDEKHLPHIFERFYRVDEARTRTVASSGLGLSIAKNIIDAHHGKITVDSKLNKGTTFTIFIPIK